MAVSSPKGPATGRIRKLGAEAVSLLRTSVSITSVALCVEELVLNALDAHASRIEVRVNMNTFSVCVSDNGVGLDLENLRLIGERYTTSKFDGEDMYYDADGNEAFTKNVLARPPRQFGFFGEALASLRDISTLEIYTKTSTGPSLLKKFKDGALVCCSDVCAPKPSAGTTVQVHRLFYNMPLRQRGQPAAALSHIKQTVQRMAIIHPQVTFKLINDVNNKIIVEAKQCESSLQAFRDTFLTLGATMLDNLHTLRRVDDTGQQYTLEGFLSTIGHFSKSYQFVFLNKRLLRKSVLHKHINGVIKDSSLSGLRMTAADTDTGPQYSPPIAKAEKFGVYVLNLITNVPHDVCIHHDKSLVEFKDWDAVLNFVDEAISTFLAAHGLLHGLAQECNVESESLGKSPGGRSSVLLPSKVYEYHGSYLRSAPVKRKYTEPPASTPQKRRFISSPVYSQYGSPVTDISNAYTLRNTPRTPGHSKRQARTRQGTPGLAKVTDKFKAKLASMGYSPRSLSKTESPASANPKTTCAVATDLLTSPAKSHRKPNSGCDSRLQSSSLGVASTRSQIGSNNGNITEMHESMQAVLRGGGEANASESNSIAVAHCITCTASDTAGDVLSALGAHGTLNKDFEKVENPDDPLAFTNEPVRVQNDDEDDGKEEDSTRKPSQLAALSGSLGCPSEETTNPSAIPPALPNATSKSKRRLPQSKHQSCFNLQRQIPPLFRAHAAPHNSTARREKQSKEAQSIEQTFPRRDFKTSAQLGTDSQGPTHSRPRPSKPSSNQNDTYEQSHYTLKTHVPTFGSHLDRYPGRLSRPCSSVTPGTGVTDPSRAQHEPHLPSQSEFGTEPVCQFQLQSLPFLQDVVKRSVEARANTTPVVSTSTKHKPGTLTHKEINLHSFAKRSSCSAFAPTGSKDVRQKTPLDAEMPTVITNQEVSDHEAAIVSSDEENSNTSQSPAMTAVDLASEAQNIIRQKVQNVDELPAVSVCQEVSDQAMSSTSRKNPSLKIPAPTTRRGLAIARDEGGCILSTTGCVNKSNSTVAKSTQPKEPLKHVEKHLSRRERLVSKGYGSRDIEQLNAIIREGVSDSKLNAALVTMEQSKVEKHRAEPAQHVPTSGVGGLKEKKGTASSEDSETSTELNVTSILAEWENPVLRPMGQPLRCYSASYAKFLKGAEVTSAEPVLFTRDMLDKARVLKQMDKSYIVCLLPYRTNAVDNPVVALLDQHAAHERLRLEEILSEFSKGRQNNIGPVPLDPFIAVKVTEEDAQCVQQQCEALLRWGIEVIVDLEAAFDERIIVCSLPEVFKTGIREDEVGHVVRTLMNEQIHIHRNTGSMTTILPRVMKRVFNHVACRGAIKFGDELGIDVCRQIVADLAKCDLPFQCAHGRPTLIPLADLEQIDKYRLVKQKQSSGEKRMALA
ncbi:hypothetical protein, variant [Sphaeroforma arctica JP610]|uniref:MutL C-terminal dimerisation domain-containing protein n=1 Tax=Sphaeroforma arctica JP610 TaxID=667725 RepID=A0A0L0GBD6_9EUKA|nr:hypothetical protein, variant [Sphaeroforma arctica JP610]KNC86332.1 hypothetical protein, variant [Sphaeroforma arctica JP610]|eukprot:XP_014160235.1 hypothetical protein, variant [Sphaeroforma arctica JP610]